MFKKYIIKAVKDWVENRVRESINGAVETIEIKRDMEIEKQIEKFADDTGYEEKPKSGGVYGMYIGMEWVKKPTTITKAEAEKRLDIKIKK